MIQLIEGGALSLASITGAIYLYTTFMVAVAPGDELKHGGSILGAILGVLCLIGLTVAAVSDFQRKALLKQVAGSGLTAEDQAKGAAVREARLARGELPTTMLRGETTDLSVGERAAQLRLAAGGVRLPFLGVAAVGVVVGLVGFFFHKASARIDEVVEGVLYAGSKNPAAAMSEALRAKHMDVAPDEIQVLHREDGSDNGSTTVYTTIRSPRAGIYHGTETFMRTVVARASSMATGGRKEAWPVSSTPETLRWLAMILGFGLALVSVLLAFKRPQG